MKFDDVIKTIKSILEINENCSIDVNKDFSNYWFNGDNDETELRISMLADFQITVSRINLINKRQGCFTAVMNVLLDFAKTNKIKRILVQCVLTEEMAAFCHKNGFIPTPYCVQMDTFLSGDYVLTIAEREI